MEFSLEIKKSLLVWKKLGSNYLALLADMSIFCRNQYIDRIDRCVWTLILDFPVPVPKFYAQMLFRMLKNLNSFDKTQICFYIFSSTTCDIALKLNETTKKVFQLCLYLYEGNFLSLYYITVLTKIEFLYNIVKSCISIKLMVKIGNLK